MRSSIVPWLTEVPLRYDIPRRRRSFEAILRRLDRRATTRIARLGQRLMLRLAILWLSVSIFYVMAGVVRDSLRRRVRNIA